MARLHCPVCDSTDIFLVAGGFTGILYRCKRCGYEGPLVIERYEDAEPEPRNSSKRLKYGQEGH
jgi:transposase-like protein